MDTIATAHNDNRDNAEIKIILVGDKGVGKSTLLDQFWGPNSNGTQPTASMRYYEIYKEVAVQIRFIDPFHENFSEERESLISQADGVLLIYDITNASSFESISDWMAILKRACSSPFVETMIIGNKSDLEGQRVISKEQGHELSSQLGALAFREMSVVNFNQEPFIWMLMGIYLRRKLRNQDATDKQRIKEQRSSRERGERGIQQENSV